MDHWDTFADDYDRVFLEYPQYVRSIEMMLDLVSEVQAGNVIDIGCGTGNVSEKVLQVIPRARVLGVDPSEGMKDTYNRRFEGESRVNFVSGSALRMPVDDGLFDLALSNLALHHVPPDERGRCASRLAKVLRPGGVLVYADLFTDSDGPPRDPAWCRDVIEKHAAAAYHCLDNGAYDMMLIMMGTLGRTLRQDGEYLTSEHTWIVELEKAGFGNFLVVPVPPEDVGFRILRAVKSQ
jgi:ubiquinone/menaquinone biosynthesis C-methylase UbiE